MNFVVCAHFQVNASRIKAARASAKHAKAAADAQKWAEPTVKSRPIAQGKGGGDATDTGDSQAANSGCNSGHFNNCSSSRSSSDGTGWAQATLDDKLHAIEKAQSAQEAVATASQGSIETEDEPSALTPEAADSLPSEGADDNNGASSLSPGSSSNSTTTAAVIPLNHCVGLCALVFAAAGLLGWFGGRASASQAHVQAEHAKEAAWLSEKALLLEQAASLEVQAGEAQGRIVVLEQERDEALAAAERARAKQREIEVKELRKKKKDLLRTHTTLFAHRNESRLFVLATLHLAQISSSFFFQFPSYGFGPIEGGAHGSTRRARRSGHRHLAQRVQRFHRHGRRPPPPRQPFRW